ncbi:hypothetical protein SDRG_06541 [Saprolegnia diclina VS20]|uniref:USP domain-containing protein n=1 Tax=Saprolegnia diclina (strain VS20) TaxID=1156394 RepID=T0RZF7_SAPDV|nr:hypothetical protein SDRG_06541 [Saprolegnia diclina VS20]EQC35782.1 hypothetical protein SDRG_06541 [Saprolegnia diclina VS20]|eukprot:XP_008610544.1 hypothetical protein SDRG_06541 [Saprolegnia diclina VS20]
MTTHSRVLPGDHEGDHRSAPASLVVQGRPAASASADERTVVALEHEATGLRDEIAQPQGQMRRSATTIDELRGVRNKIEVDMGALANENAMLKRQLHDARGKAAAYADMQARLETAHGVTVQQLDATVARHVTTIQELRQRIAGDNTAAERLSTANTRIDALSDQLETGRACLTYRTNQARSLARHLDHEQSSRGAESDALRPMDLRRLVLRPLATSVGLANLGHTSYANAVLFALAHTRFCDELSAASGDAFTTSVAELLVAIRNGDASFFHATHPALANHLGRSAEDATNFGAQLAPVCVRCGHEPVTSLSVSVDLEPSLAAALNDDRTQKRRAMVNNLHLTLHEATYTLVALVAHEEADDDGHYVAYVRLRRGGAFTKMKDNETPVRVPPFNVQVLEAHLLWYEKTEHYAEMRRDDSSNSNDNNDDQATRGKRPASITPAARKTQRTA